MRSETTTEEWGEDSLVYVRRPGREEFELVVVRADSSKQIIIKVSPEQMARLSVDSSAASVVQVDQLRRKIAK